MNDAKMNRRTAIKTAAVAGAGTLVISKDFLIAQEAAKPFGAEFRKLELLTTGEWWKRPGNNGTPLKRGRKSIPPNLNVSRDKVGRLPCIPIKTECLN